MEYEMISEKELDRLLEKEQGFVIDLRSPWEYAAYHIPGAVNIPYERLKKVRGLPKNVPLIFYCERGSVSMVAAREISETFRTISRQIRYSVFWEDEAICAMEKMPEKEKKAIWGEQIRILREAIYGSEEELEKQIEVIFSGIREKEDLEDCKILLPSVWI